MTDKSSNSFSNSLEIVSNLSLYILVVGDMILRGLCEKWMWVFCVLWLFFNGESKLFNLTGVRVIYSFEGLGCSVWCSLLILEWSFDTIVGVESFKLLSKNAVEDSPWGASSIAPSVGMGDVGTKDMVPLKKKMDQPFLLSVSIRLYLQFDFWSNLLEITKRKKRCKYIIDCP